MMPYTTPEIVRGKLTTAFARAAFDKLNAMGPKWSYAEESKGVYLSPDIHTKHTWDCLVFPVVSRAKTVDEAVINTLLKLQKEIGDQDKVALINVATPTQKEFTYHTQAGVFVPYEPKRS